MGRDSGPLTLGFDEPAPDAGSGRGFVIRTDGAARGNPGPASAGAALIALERSDAHDPRATPDATISEYLGIRTNNVAEYIGVLRAVRLAAELGAGRVELLLDSNLIVEQLHGRWRVCPVRSVVPGGSIGLHALGRAPGPRPAPRSRGTAPGRGNRPRC